MEVDGGENTLFGMIRGQEIGAELGEAMVDAVIRLQKDGRCDLDRAKITL